MAQLAVYLEDKVARAVNRMARRAGLSRSKWVSHLVKRELEQKIPDDFFQVLGQWEDGRSPQEIIQDIRQRVTQRERAPLR